MAKNTSDPTAINQIKTQEVENAKAIEVAKQQVDANLQDLRNDHEEKMTSADELIQQEKVDILEKTKAGIKEKKQGYEQKQQELLAKLENITDSNIDNVAIGAVARIKELVKAKN